MRRNVHGAITKNLIGHEVVQAIKDLGVDPEKNSAAVSLKICRATC
jgi:hypothetical protein